MFYRCMTTLEFIASAPHCIGLSFATNGFQPFKHSATSVWPMLLVVCNLPAHIRFKRQYVLLSGLIPAKPSFLQPYLQPLVAELNSLYSQGFMTFCARCNREVEVRVKLLFTVADYPGNCLLTAQQQQGELYVTHTSSICLLHDCQCSVLLKCHSNVVCGAFM